MRRIIAASAVLSLILQVGQANAFGLGDLVSIGIQAGGKLVGAAIDKGIDTVKESMRDPEAEARKKVEQERKLAEQLQKQIDKIEATPNLRPIDREKLVIQLKESYQAVKEMQAFIEKAEAQQKAERDKIFTAGGIFGVVGEAAMSSPSMVMARANAMTQNPVWQAQRHASNEAIFAQANAQVAAGVPQANARAILAQADVLQKSGIPQAGAKTIVDNAEGLATAKDAAIQAAPAANAAPSSEEAGNSSNAGADDSDNASLSRIANATAPMPADAFSPDLGKKLWIEFEDSPTETAALRKLLQQHGHILAPSKEEAEVVYLVQGEFEIPESKLHEGLTKSLGALLENPATTIEPPPAKAMGKFSVGIMSALLGSAGRQMPETATKGYRQRALLVIARQPKDGKETRASVIQKAQGEAIEAAKLAKAAREDLYQQLGI